MLEHLLYMSESMNPTTDDFASMFEAAIEASPMQEGKVISGLVTGIEKTSSLLTLA